MKPGRAAAARYFGPGVARWDTRLDSFVEKLEGLGITPYEYFSYMLENYPGVASYSNVLYSEKALEKYWDYKDSRERRAKLNGYLDFDSFESRINLGAEPAEILDDPEVELTPLFRYVMAITLGYYDLAGKFHDAAERQLLEAPEYREVYSKYKAVLPEGGGDDKS